jgi:hypothetical protein
MYSCTTTGESKLSKDSNSGNTSRGPEMHMKKKRKRYGNEHKTKENFKLIPATSRHRCPWGSQNATRHAHRAAASSKSKSPVLRREKIRSIECACYVTIDNERIKKIYYSGVKETTHLVLVGSG